MDFNWDRHAEAARRAEESVKDQAKEVAKMKVTLEELRRDREAAPAKISDAAMGYRQAEAALVEGVAKLVELHCEGLRQINL